MKLMQSVFSCFFLITHLTSVGNIDSLKLALVDLGEAERAPTLHQIGTKYLKKGYPDSSLMYLETAVDLAEKYGQLDVAAECKNNLGVAHHSLGNYAEAIIMYKSAIELHEQLGTDSLSKQSKLNLGLSYKKVGAFDEAIKHYEVVIRYCEETNDPKLLATVANALGNIHRGLENFERSLEYHDRALKIRLEHQDSLKAASSLHNAALSLKELGRLDEAKEMLWLASRMKRAHGASPKTKANTLAQLGEIYLEESALDSAKYYLNSSLLMRIEAGDKEGISSSYRHLGKLAVLQGDFIHAKTLFDTAFVLARQINAVAILLDISKHQKQLAQHTNSIEIALAWSDSVLFYNNEVIGSENQNAVAAFEVRYDLLKSELALSEQTQQNLLLTIENNELSIWIYSLTLILLIVIVLPIAAAYVLRKIRKQNAVLEATNREIETLHHELQHRTKNYFQMLRGIFTIHIRTSEDKALTAILRDYRARIDAMSDVHNHLSSASAKDVKLDQYLDDTVGNLKQAFHFDQLGFDLQSKFDPLTMHYDQAMKLGLIVNELITNAVKYGLPTATNPKLTVEARIVDKTNLELRVQDNGEGGEESEANTLAQGTSLGTSLVAMLAQNLGATISTKTESGYQTVLRMPCQ